MVKNQFSRAELSEIYMVVIKKIDQVISTVTEWILSYSIIGMAVILLINILSRRVFNYSLKVADELGASLIILVTFSGIGYAAKKGRHIRMSALFDVFSYKIKKIVIVGTSLITFATYILVTVYAIHYIKYTIMLQRVTAAMEIPAWIQQLIIPIGFTLGAIQYLMNFVVNITDKRIYIGTEMAQEEERT